MEPVVDLDDDDAMFLLPPSAVPAEDDRLWSRSVQGVSMLDNFSLDGGDDQDEGSQMDVDDVQSGGGVTDMNTDRDLLKRRERSNSDDCSTCASTASRSRTASLTSI